MTSEYIRINKLKGTTNTTAASAAKQVYYGSSKKYRMYQGSTIVWDVLKATFTASNFTIGANGGNIATAASSVVTSYGTNALGVNETLTYTAKLSNGSTTIPANTTHDKKTHTVILTQSGTNNQLTVTCTQDGKEDTIKEYKYTVSVTSESISDADAGGSTLTLYASGTVYKIAVYVSGKEEQVDYETFSSKAVTITGGSVKNTVAYLYNGKIEVDSAERDTYSSDRHVYTISSYTVTSSWGTHTVSGRSKYVYQNANTMTTTYYTPVAYIYYDDVGADGSAAYPTIYYEQDYVEEYTSGIEDEDMLEGEISPSATSGKYIYSISSSGAVNGASMTTTSGSTNRGRVTANSLGYTAKDRTKILTVKIVIRVNNKNSASTSEDVYQEANRINEQYQAPVIGTVETVADISASGSGAAIRAYYTQNKKTWSTANPTGKTEQVANSSTTSVTLSGSKYSNGTTNNSGNNAKISGSKVVADPWPAKVYSRQKVFTITSVSITVNGVTGSKNPNLSVYQAANSITNTSYSASSSDIKLTADPQYPLATTHFSKVYVTATATQTDTYTSGKTAQTTGVSRSAKLSITSGTGATLSSTSVSNGSSTQITYNENTTASKRTFTVKAVHTDNSSVYTTVTITQDPAEYIFEIKPTSVEFTYSGGTQTVVIESMLNDTAVKPTVTNNTGWVQMSGPTINDITMTSYNLTLTAPANSSTSAKSGTITVKHPNVSNSKTITVSQAGKPSTPSDSTTVEIEAWFESTYTVGFTVTISTTSGYVNENMLIKVQDNPYSDNSDYYGRFEYPSPLYDGTTYTNTIILDSYPPSPAYLAVYIGDKFKDAVNIY